MIVILLIIGAAYFLLKGGQLNIAAATSPVINNATGSSLGNALGSGTQPPSNFSTGTPGYTSQPTPMPVVAGPSAIPSSAPVSVAQQSGAPANTPIVRPAPVRILTPVISGTRRQAPVVAPSAVKTYSPAVGKVVTINPALTAGVVSVTKNSPETSSPPWASFVRTRKVSTY